MNNSSMLEQKAGLDRKWQKAAVIGSLWAAIEIILGSFLHNLRVPFTGAILASFGICLLVSSNLNWHEYGIFWRAGLICAVMKSISPSAVILGPMIGIFAEGLILEIFIRLFGKNIFGYLLGGSFAVASTFIQSVINLLILYGFNLVEIYLRTYQLAVKNIRLEFIGPWDLILIVIFIHLLLGMIMALLGFSIGKKSKSSNNENEISIKIKDSADFLKINYNHSFSLFLFILHPLLIVICLYIVSYYNIYVSIVLVIGYILLCIYRYKGAINRFKRPRIWIEFIIIIFLSALVLGGTTDVNQTIDGIYIGFQMILRAALIIIGFSAISLELRNPRIINWIFSIGMGNLYSSIELAFESLPVAISALGEQKQIFRRPVITVANLIGKMDDLLKEIQNKASHSRKIIIITGKQGSGKTNTVIKISEFLINSGLRIRGIVAPGYWLNSTRSHFEVMDLNTKKKMILCDSNPVNYDQQIGKFYFKKEGIEFGRKALEPENLKKADCIILDEIGNLELAGGGWISEFEFILNNATQPFIIVIRKDLLKDISQRWNLIPTIIFDPDENDFSKLLEQIKKLCSENQTWN